MSFVQEKDVAVKGRLTATVFKNGLTYKLKVVDYKKEQGGRFPDQEGFQTSYTFELLDEKLKDYADAENRGIFVCNSARLRRKMFAEDINLGDVILLMRTGKGTSGDYTIEKVADLLQT